MGLREKFYAFSDRLDNRSFEKAMKKDAEKRERLNQKIEALADSLPEKIRKYQKKNPDGEYMFFRFTEENGYGTMKELSGYRRLHEACAAENVGVHAFEIPGCFSVMVLPHNPYDTSPDAGILVPKKPSWVQPPLPGF